MGNSIFSDPNYNSPLGNWTTTGGTKALSIKYQNCQSDDSFFYINFQVTAKNLTSSEAYIFMGESEVFGSETAVPNTKIEININGTTITTVQFKRDFKFSKSIFEGDLEFFALVTCDNLSAKTDEFSLACIKKIQVKPKDNKPKNESESEKAEPSDCGYNIKDGFLIGTNVSTSRKDSKVKPGGDLNTVVKAIVLHRTVGSGIGGAITHGKGTHFYVEGNRQGIDGEIFQAMTLKKRSSHIKDVDTRISHFDVKNENSIGIEVIGLAYLKEGDKLYKNLAGKPEVLAPFPPLTREFIDKNKKKNYWDALTEAQIKSVVCLVKLLMKEYSIPLSMVLTHEEIQQKTAGEGQAVREAIIQYFTK